MPKRQKGPKNFKNDGSVDDPVHIQLSYVLHCSDSPLVELEDVFLHVNANIFQDLVNDRDTEFRMPSLKIKDEICELRNITKLDLPNICKGREDKAVDLKRLKVRGCAKQLDSNALSLSLTSGSSQCNFLSSFNTLSRVRFINTSSRRCRMKLCIGVSCTTSLTTLSGGLHYDFLH